jgi:predicted TIM-barrel fold metal-dependent hydrolase
MSYAFELACAQGVIDVSRSPRDSLCTNTVAGDGNHVALLDVTTDRAARRAVRENPGRSWASWTVDPNSGMDGVRNLVRAVETLGVRAACLRPSNLVPAVPIDHKHAFAIYAKCVELGLPILIDVGIPTEAVAMSPQKVERLDEICCAFPELTVVTRHGGEPWTPLLVALMRKWPNLYFSTVDVAPAALAPEIVDYANSDGASKVLFGSGTVGFDRALEELPKVPFADDVWTPFLRDNARRVLEARSA